MNETVTLAHGAGGRQTAELIDKVFKEHFANPDLTSDDAAVLSVEAGKLAFTTDGFIVSPAEFPGGNIGKLSICGTVNDLACMGAKPLYLSCAFVIEEGFPMEKLEKIGFMYAFVLCPLQPPHGNFLCPGRTDRRICPVVDPAFYLALSGYTDREFLPGSGSLFR